MRLPRLPLELPQTIVNRALGDVAAIALAARSAPDQIDRLLAIGEEIVEIGNRVLELGERIDRRAEAIMELGEQIDGRAAELLETGKGMRELGERIEARGGEITEGASRVVETGNDLIAVMPTFERALEMATPLEGAIDRFGRLVDRLPGGAPRRRPTASDTDPTAPAREP